MLDRHGLALVGLLAVLPYLNALSGGFILDDRSVITHHPAVQNPFNLRAILSAPLLGDIPNSPIWRPLTTLSFALDWRIGGHGPFWFHLVNLLLYGGIAVLWTLLIRRMFGPGLLPWIAGSLFAVHPIHTEAVSWISGRPDLLAAFFGLIALHLAIDPRSSWRRLTPLAVLFAMGSKESAAVLPAVLLYTHWAFRKDRKGPSIALGLASIIPVVLYLILRRETQGSWFHQGIDPLDNPLLGTSLFQRIPTVLDLVGRYAVLLLWPARLSIDYSAPVLGRVSGITPGLVVGLAVSVAFLYLALARPASPAGWGAGFSLLVFALASNLLFPVVTLFAERLLFLPSAGILLVLSASLLSLASTSRSRLHPTGAPLGWRLQRRSPAVAAAIRWGLLGLWIVALPAGCARTWLRNPDFHDETSLFEAGVRAAPLSYKMHADLALIDLRRGRMEDALRESDAAIRLLPAGREARDFKAQALETLGRRDAAIRFLRGALASDPEDQASRARILELLNDAGRMAEMDSLAEAAMAVDPADVRWIDWSAKGAQARRDYARAAELWREVVRRTGSGAEPALNLAFCLLQTGDALGAKSAYVEALRRDPSSAAAENGLAWTLLSTGGSPEEAVQAAERATKMSPIGPYFDTLARACLTAGHLDRALEAADVACRLDPRNADYAETRRSIEARRGGIR